MRFKSKIITCSRKISDCLLFILILNLFLSACTEEYSPEIKKYIAEIEQHRKNQDDYFRDDPNSPFHYKGEVEFHPLKYFDVNPAFRFESKLYEYEPKDTVIIYGTKGEPRQTVRYGFFVINHENKKHMINVYQSISRDGEKYYSVWFTDKTTDDESYGVGRYLDIDKMENPDFIYSVDFNLAYNPYCAYNMNYSCAIPTKEDYIDIAVEAGEKKFHD